jgi:hypothetical protein
LNNEIKELESNRGQKEIIIRRNSSKKLLNRPTSQGGQQINTHEDISKKKSKMKQHQVMQQSSAIDTSLLNNSSYIGQNSFINSPTGQNMQAIRFKNNPNVINHTESTNVNSDNHKGSKSMPHKQQQFWKHEEQKQIAALNEM